MLKRVIPLRIRNMHKIVSSFFVAYFLIFFGVDEVIALNKKQPDAENPIEIYSKTAEFEDEKITATYKGSVVLHQGEHHLTSNVLVILRGQDGKIESIIATGNPANFRTTPNPNKPMLKGHAKTIKFYPKQGKLMLLQNAVLTQNNETIQSEKLSYCLSTHVLLSSPTFGKKTTIRLAPKSSSLNILSTGNQTP